MDNNVGGIDRKARLIAGVLILALGSAGFVINQLQTLSVATMVGVSVMVLATAATQKCPVNALLGINTCVGEAASDFEP